MSPATWALGAFFISCGPSGSRDFTGPPVTSVREGGFTGTDATGGTGGAPDAARPEVPGVDDPTPGKGGAGPATSSGGAGGGSPGAPDAAVTPDLVSEPPPEPPPPDAAEPDLGVVDLAPPPDLSAPDTGGVGLALGLISHWTLEEGAGNAVKDSMNVNPGTVSGAVWAGGFREPPSKAALHFDGDNDYVELGVKNLPGLNKPQTVAFWFRIGAAPSGTNLAIAFSTAATGGNARLKLGLRNNGVIAAKSGQDVLVVTGLPTVNAWHHYVWAFDGRTNYLYLDGVEKNRSTTAPDNATANSARIGAGHNNAENFNGDVDEVRIYGRAITAGEAAALAAGQE